MTTVTAQGTAATGNGPKPETIDEADPFARRFLVATFMAIPFAAVLAAIPLAMKYHFIDWHDPIIGAVFFVNCIAGIGTWHRGFTHGAYKMSRRFIRAAAIAGSIAIEGPILVWVSDHRRHHKYSDREGDLHSPWAFVKDPYGERNWRTDLWALIRGFFHAHNGWMLTRKDRTNISKFAPDWEANTDVKWISDHFYLFVIFSLLAPALIGGLWGMSFHAALTAFFWGALVRIFLTHHVTWSINSICHTFGTEEFEARDKSKNVAWLAILSFGESWHNTHHADPTLARHGVCRGQLDVNARLSSWFEAWGRRCARAGKPDRWIWDVKWPDYDRLEGKHLKGAKHRIRDRYRKEALAEAA